MKLSYYNMHMNHIGHDMVERQMDLMSLVQQLHPLLEDLAVVLSTLPQHLSPELLHGGPQLLPLKFIQGFTVFNHLVEAGKVILMILQHQLQHHRTAGPRQAKAVILKVWGRIIIHSIPLIYF